MKYVLTIAALALALSTPAVAAPITVPSGGTWIPVTAPNQDGTPFWDNTSWDGANQNVGFRLQSLLGAQYGNLEYLDVASFVIGATGQNVELKVEVAGQAGNNALYYNNGGADQLIFSGAAAPGATFAGPIAGPFSFVFYSNGSPANAWSSSSDSWDQQFALFRLTGTQQYFLGIEDLTNGDWDYNDMIVSFELQAPPVPEPGTLLLFGAGILGAAARLRRRARS